MRANFVMSGVGQGLRRNVLMMITFVSLYFLGGALLTQKEIDKFRSTYEDRLDVSIYLCGPTKDQNCKHPFTAQERSSLEGQLQSDPLIVSERFVSQNQIFKNNPNYLGLGDLDILQASDFPNLISVKLKDIKRD
jgi:cell division transport system permease protein